VQVADRFPYSFRMALEQTRIENLFDSNMFSAYIPRELPIPRIDDPRQAQRRPIGVERHPSYVPSPKIDQVFSYLGFVKRMDNAAYRPYLPMLYTELTRFLRVIEDMVYRLNIAIPAEIYQEQKRGLERFFLAYRENAGRTIEWIGKIWKHQKFYLEHLDMLIETLKMRGRVFDCSADPLYTEILLVCRGCVHAGEGDAPGEKDIRCVANCCAKAARDGESKNLWSGDRHILRILKALYTQSALCARFPQIYLYSSYEPGNHAQWFPVEVKAGSTTPHWRQAPALAGVQ
jgi:hypothetical protein